MAVPGAILPHRGACRLMLVKHRDRPTPMQKSPAQQSRIKLVEAVRTWQGGQSLPAAQCPPSPSHPPKWPKHGKAAFRPLIVSLAFIARSGGGWRRHLESPKRLFKILHLALPPLHFACPRGPDRASEGLHGDQNRRDQEGHPSRQALNGRRALCI